MSSLLSKCPAKLLILDPAYALLPGSCPSLEKPLAGAYIIKKSRVRDDYRILLHTFKKDLTVKVFLDLGFNSIGSCDMEMARKMM